MFWITQNSFWIAHRICLNCAQNTLELCKGCGILIARRIFLNCRRIFSWIAHKNTLRSRRKNADGISSVRTAHLGDLATWHWHNHLWHAVVYSNANTTYVVRQQSSNITFSRASLSCIACSTSLVARFSEQLYVSLALNNSCHSFQNHGQQNKTMRRLQSPEVRKINARHGAFHRVWGRQGRLPGINKTEICECSKTIRIGWINKWAKKIGTQRVHVSEQFEW